VSKPPPGPIYVLLRVWAGKIEGDLLSPEDRAEIAKLLRGLASGQTVDDVFGVWRPANRPPDHAREQRLYDMAWMRLAVELGGEGLSYPKTIKLTAERYGKSVETIARDYKSPQGREIRKEVLADAQVQRGGITRE
jgi:hypothetical protein